MIKEIIFMLALADFVAVILSVYKGKKNLSLALGILEAVLVYLYFISP